MAKQYNSPPNWPNPPEGWTPPAGWNPDPGWGPAPEGHEFWVDDGRPDPNTIHPAYLTSEQQQPERPSPEGHRATADAAGGRGLAIAALAVAIVSLALCWIPIVNNVVFFLGILGLVLAFIAHRRARKGKSEGKGLAFAAILISILSLVGVIATQAFYSEILDDVGQAFEEGVEGDSAKSDSDKEQEAEAEIQPLGSSSSVGSEYTVAVTKVNLDADQVVERTNEFNEPPSGRYVIATLDVTYTGSEEGDPWLDLEPTFAGSDSRQYTSASCEAVVSQAAVDVPTLNDGGEATYKVCFDVPPQAIDDGTLFVEESLALETSRVYWAIR